MKEKVIKILATIFIVIIMFVLILLLMKKNGVFQLQAVKVHNNYFVTKQEISRLAEFDFSKDLFQINLLQIANRLEKHPMIEKVKVSRSYPSVLKIQVQEHQLIAAMAGSDVLAISENENFISNYAPEAVYDLPVITGIHLVNDSTGKKVIENQILMDRAVKILKMIKKNDPFLYSEISELNCSKKGEIIFHLKENDVVVFLGNKDYIRKLNYFATIFYHLVENKKLAKILAIDVRYEGQAVIKSKS